VESSSHPTEPKHYFRSSAGLVVAVSVVLILLIWLPAYRWFFLISLGIGIIVALVLYVWNKYRPLEEKDIAKKRPLGLD
jgi:hypothetical protein